MLRAVLRPAYRSQQPAERTLPGDSDLTEEDRARRRTGSGPDICQVAGADAELFRRGAAERARAGISESCVRLLPRAAREARPWRLGLGLDSDA